jgi:hypothetical protein
MNFKRGRVIWAITLTVLSFFSVCYFACNKVDNPAACDGVICQNGSSCVHGQCMCLVGYEDSACSTPIINKYLGTWDVTQKIIGSDSLKDTGTWSYYMVQIKPTATPTTFFVYDFLGNQNYNKVVGTLDGTNSYHFYFDTTVNYQMWFAPIHFYGGEGYIKYLPVPEITATVTMTVLNSVHNYQKDTISMVMTPHH